MSRRTVLRGGYVLTLDDELGELPRGDVLIEDDRIVAVARRWAPSPRRGTSHAGGRSSQ